jgi:hypothetical protein
MIYVSALVVARTDRHRGSACFLGTPTCKRAAAYIEQEEGATRASKSAPRAWSVRRRRLVTRLPRVARDELQVGGR